MKYPNVLYTALLSAFLVIPFTLRCFAPILEPYPAVLLPSGAGRIKAAEDQMDFVKTAIYGRVAGRETWTRLSPSKFLNPVPLEFFPPLAERYFGLSPVGPKASSTRVGPLLAINPRKVGDVEVRNVEQWFRGRLKGSGCEDNVLRITQEVVTVRRADGAELAVRYEHDNVFNLR